MTGAPSLTVGEVGAFGRRLLEQLPQFGDLPQRTFRLHGLTLCVRSAAADYLELCERALVDDPANDNRQEARLDVTVIDRSQEPRALHARLLAREVAADDITKAMAAAGLDGMLVGHGESWQVFDPRRSAGIETVSALDRLAPWERSTPLVNFLHWGLQARGRRLLHAGTLAHGGVGVLVVGAGGAGKSGTVLSGIVNGLDSTGDDYIALEQSANGVLSFPITRLMKQDRAGLQRLGIDPDDSFGPVNWQSKHEFDFERFGRGRRAPSIRLAGIVLPRIAWTTRTEFVPVAAREAAMALIPSNLQQLPGGRPEGVRFVADMARRLPAFRMNLSSDPAEIAGAVRDLITRLAP